MTERTWIGGGKNKASNPHHWNPAGVPQPGDALSLPFGSTINIADDDLQGDVLTVSSGPDPDATTTLNLRHHADVILSAGLGARPSVTVNVHGTGTLHLGTGPSAADGAAVSVNVPGNAKLFGTFDLIYSSLTMSGGNHSVWENNETTALAASQAIIAVDVQGSGTINVFSATLGSHMEFAGYVSPGQMVNLRGNSDRPGSSLTIDDPQDFHGAIAFRGAPSALASTADLVGLATADSWSYSNDLLSLFDSCGHLVDRRTVISDDEFRAPEHGLAVTRSAGGDVVLAAGHDFGGMITSALS